ncbi:MAG: translocation/assembly module TamB domain-containing protein, partial [Caulobacterales bacterium]
VVALIGAGGVLFLKSPAGLNFIEDAADGAKAGRLGTLSLKNLKGDPFGTLHADRVAIADSKGEWLVVENVSLTLNPWPIFGRIVQIKSASARRVGVLRRPMLEPPKKDKGKALVDFDLQALSLPDVDVAKGVAGPAARLKMAAAALSRRNGDSSAHLDLRRLDADTDLLLLDWRSIKDVMTLKASGRGAPGGLFANLLETPKGAAIALSAAAQGDPDAGHAGINLSVGGAPAFRAGGSWKSGAVDATLSGDLNSIAPTRVFAERLGGPFEAKLKLTPAADALQNLDLDARFARLTAHASGLVNSDQRTAPKGLDVTAQAPKLNALGGGLEWASGPAQIDGKVFAVDSGYGFRGNARVEQFDRFSVSARSVSGPVDVRMNDDAINFQGALQTAGVSAKQKQLAGLLGVKPAISVNGAYIRKTGEVRFTQARLDSPAANAQASGEIDPDGPIRLEGVININTLSAVQAGVKGRANFRFGAARANPKAPLQISAQGSGAGLSGENQIVQLLGPSPKLQIETDAPSGGGWRIQRANLDGKNLRLGAKGAASADGVLNIDLQGTARGPFKAGGTNIEGVIDADGKVTGTQDNPRIALQARSDKIDAAGVHLVKAVLDVEIPDMGEALAGSIKLNSATPQDPVTASALFAVADGRTSVTKIDANWSGVLANGDIAFGGDAPMTGTLAAKGPFAPFTGSPGEFAANLALTNSSGVQGVDLSASATRLSFERGRIFVSSARLRARGTEEDLNVVLSAAGEAGQAFVLNVNGPIKKTGDVRQALITLRGKYGEDRILTQAPIDVKYGPNSMSVLGELRLGQGAMSLDWRRQGEALDVKLALNRAPAFLGGFISPRLRLDGELSGSASFAGKGDTLRGGGEITIDNLGPEGAGAQGLDGKLALTLGDNRLRSTIDAKSAEGLTITGEADLPASVAAQPFKVKIDPKARASGKLLVKGPAKDVWRVFGPTQQYLDGSIDFNATLAGTIGKPDLSGEGTLSNGSFEDAATGMKLRDVDAGAQFAGSTLNITSATARGRSGGSAQGGGNVVFNNKGATANFNATVKDLKFLDRDDAKATGSGTIAYTARPGEAAKLSGKVVADRFDLSLAATESSAGPVIAVTHINLPPRLRIAQEKDQQAENAKPLQIDIALSAPARVFVRGRGLDSEWSLKARLQGSLSRPVLMGNAELIRGDYDLVGKRFTLDDGDIEFEGTPQQARLNITGTRAATDLTAIVKVTGTLASPEIALSSTPQLPDDEVLARVLFGRSASQLTALEAAQLAAGVAALSGKQGFDIAGIFRGVGLDRVSFGGAEDGEATVSGGKYIAENVYVEVVGGAAGDPGAQVEWEPRPNLSLVSRFSGNDSSRFSVRWKKDY